MKKALLLAATALIGLAPNANALEQLTRANCQEKIADGAYIALQCKDWNGGINYFFNSNQKKSLHLTSAQIFKIVKGAEDTGFYMQRVSDGKFIGKGASNPSIVDSKKDATPWSVQGVSCSGWTTKPEEIVSSTAPTIRFITEGTFLNTREENSVPNWATGTGGFSAWYVYSFTQEEVDHFVALDSDSYSPVVAFSDFDGKNILVSESASTSIDPREKEWFMIRSVGRSNATNGERYLKQEGKNLLFVNINDAASGYKANGSAVDNAAFLFKVDPAKISDFGTAYNNIITGFGDYVMISGSDEPQYKNGRASIVGGFPRSMSIENVAEDGAPASTEFIIVDKHFPGKDGDQEKTYVANAANDDAAERGMTFIGWQNSTNVDKSDVNNLFEFYKVALIDEGETVLDYNVEFTYEGKVVGTMTVSGVAGDNKVISSPNFFTDEFDVLLPENNTEPISLELKTLILPFEASATTADVKWQYVRQHVGVQRNKNHVWYYTEGDTNAKTHTLTNVGINGFEEGEMWAFVGNMSDGFRIYNMAAGMDKYLIQGSVVEFGTAEGDDEGKGLWLPYVAKNSADYYWTEYCCFKSVAGSGYINLQGINDAAGTAELKFHSEADFGSVCWFLAPCELMLRHANDYVFEQKEILGHPNVDHVVRQVPEEAVGALDFPNDAEFMTTGPQIIADANADPYNLETAAKLKQLIEDYDSQVILNQFDVNKWYRLLSPCHGMYIRTSDTDMTMNSIGMDSHRKNYHTVFKFDMVEGTEDDPLYTIYSQGLYFGRVTYQQNVTMVEDKADAGHFGPFDADDEPSIYGIGDFHAEGVDATTESTTYLHLGNSDSNVTGWGKWAAGSHFILMPATDIDFELNYTVADKKLGFGFFPFAVSAATEGTQLFFLHEADGKLTTSETTVVPAHTAFIACSKTDTEVTLNIVPETTPAAKVQARAGETTAAKVMAGTLRPGEAAANDYILSDNLSDGGLGFKQVTSATAVNGNSVYLPAANLSEKALESTELPLADPTTTQISEISAGSNGSAVIYDLQGRRMAAPVKGINIVNGKKILVK